ncbi:hypothetical protein ACFQ14_13675 [Pseudahrensia aquimaris]|uniref:Transmembrane protein (PGPGW) n=1 Tax=Pseudahrensia aquimaris TaxID=744461 RepID=A0ABW3FMU3_9HYPH
MDLKSSMPGTRLGRTALGVALILGGILGFLPILGFWMIPLGLFVLSQDFASIRRFRRKLLVRFGRRFGVGQSVKRNDGSGS